MKFKFQFKKNLGEQPAKKWFSLKQIYYLVYLVAFATLAYLGNFIYLNYYQTVTQANEIADLKKEVSPESIDLEHVNKILDAIDSKTSSTEPIVNDQVKNPFSQSAQAPITETIPTTTTTPAN